MAFDFISAYFFKSLNRTQNEPPGQIENRPKFEHKNFLKKKVQK